jgi:hypothetical protein
MGKGKKKEKLIFISVKNYSDKFSNLYNNKSLSDVTIKFPNGDSQPAHKTILSLNSEYFEKYFENSNEFTFENDVADKTAKQLIKFCYTGVLEYSEDSEIFTFMLNANKFKLKNISDLKVPPKVYFNGIIDYVEKDESRKTELEALLDSVFYFFLTIR